MIEQQENVIQLAPYQEADKDLALDLFLLAEEALIQDDSIMYCTYRAHALNLAKSIKRRQN
jgi:hypothetical protein